MVSKTECLLSLKAAIDEFNKGKGVLKSLTSEELVEAYETKLRQRQTQKDFDTSQAAEVEAMHDLAKDISLSSLKKRQHAAMAMNTRLDAIDWITKNFPGDPVEGLLSYLVGSKFAVKAGKKSVAAEQDAFARHYIGGLSYEMEKEGLLQIFIKGKLDLHTIKELDGLERGVGKQVTDSDAAYKMAKIIKSWQDHARKKANEYGAFIGETDNYITKQMHEIYKIKPKIISWAPIKRETRQQARDNWINFVMEEIDHDRVFGAMDAAKKREYLEATYNNIESGIHLTHDGRINGSHSRANIASGNLASRLSKERTLHFKSPEAWHRYQQKYGADSLANTVFGNLDQLGKSTALMKKLGPNPKDNVKRITDALRELRLNDPELSPKAKKKLQQQSGDSGVPQTIDHRMKWLCGDTRIPVNETLASVSSGIRAWASTSKLGMCLISSFTDISIGARAIAISTGGNRYFALPRMIDETLKSVTNDVDRKKRLTQMGIFSEGMLRSVQQRFDIADNPPGAISEGVNFYFNLIGMRQWTDNMRYAVANVVMNELAEVAEVGFNDLNINLKNRLLQYDITELKWDLIRRKIDVDEKGRKYLTPDAIKELDRDTVIGMLDLRSLERFKDKPEIYEALVNKKVDKFKHELLLDMKYYIIDASDEAVAMPSARVQSFVKHGSQPGTLGGEMANFFYQFKAYPLSVWDRVVQGDFYSQGYSHGIANTLGTGKNNMLGMVHTMATATLLGYVAMTTKDALRGKSARNPSDPKTWVAAMLQGGALGLYGDFIFGTQNRFGQGPLSAVMGPTFGNVETLVGLWAKMREGDDFSASLAKAAIDNVPGLGTFYVRTVFNYLFFNAIMEQLSPGYTHRMEKKLDEEDRGFLVDPLEFSVI